MDVPRRLLEGSLKYLPYDTFVPGYTNRRQDLLKGKGGCHNHNGRRSCFGFVGNRVGFETKKAFSQAPFLVVRCRSSGHGSSRAIRFTYHHQGLSAFSFFPLSRGEPFCDSQRSNCHSAVRVCGLSRGAANSLLRPCVRSDVVDTFCRGCEFLSSRAAGRNSLSPREKFLLQVPKPDKRLT